MPKQCDETCPLRAQASQQETVDEPIHLPTHDPIDQAAIAKQLYRPLKEWQARILVLKDGPLNSDLVADLLTVDLIMAPGVVVHDTQERIQYTALSYTWGTPVFSQRLIVNGLQFSITESLYLFLQRSRQSMRMRNLWIDAICINQSDNAEKSIQVANMLNIYRKAWSVRVWLGEAEPYSSLAMEYLRDYDKKRPERVKHAKECRPAIRNVMEGIESLYRRPWLQRVWVRQEVWAAARIRVMCGSNTISWHDFDNDPADKLETLAEQAKLEIEEGCPDDLLNGLSRRRVNELAEPEDDEAVAPLVGYHPNDIVTVLNHSVSSQSTDARDCIYGLLNMTKTKTRPVGGVNNDGLDLAIDYSLSVQQVFCEVARYIMKRESSTAALLCLRGHFGSSDLPSWCPDWRQETSCQPYLYYEGFVRGVKKDQVAKNKDQVANNEVEDNMDKSEHRNKPPGDQRLLPLSGHTKVRTLLWQGPIGGQTCTLMLRGVVLAKLTTETEKNLALHMGLLYHHDDRALNQHILEASEETKEGYKRQIDQEGVCHVRVKAWPRIKTYKLYDEDVYFRRGERLVVPVTESVRYQKWKSRGLWDDIKTMRATAAEGIEVPLSETKHSRIFRTYKEADGPAEKYAARRAERKAKRAAELDFKEQNLFPSARRQHFAGRRRKHFSKKPNKTLLSPPDVSSDSDSHEDISSSSSDEPNNGNKDKPSQNAKTDGGKSASSNGWEDEITSGSDSDSDSDDSDDSESEGDSESKSAGTEQNDGDDVSRTSSGGMSNVVSSVSSSVDENDTDLEQELAGEEDDEEEYSPEDTDPHYFVTNLNKLYNEHFPAEFAVTQEAQAGDFVVVVQGSALPFVLRPVDDGQYTYVGPAFLSYRSVYLPPGAPRFRYDKENLTHHRIVRPQMSIYEHFQLLLRMRVREGTEEVFGVV